MANFIKQIKAKLDDSSFSSPIFLGAEQRYVGALRGTNNDNLEEQSIIGVDCVTTEEWSGTTHRVIKEFHDGTQSTDYYKLVIIYSNETNSGIENGILTVSDYENLLRTETLYYVDKNGNDIKVSVKTVTQVVSNNKIITTEKIERKV